MSFRYALWAEWTKIRTLRSTGWVMLTAAALTIALGVHNRWTGAWPHCHTAPVGECTAFGGTRSGLREYLLVQLPTGVLGILSVTSEYATGMITTSLAAAPSRGRLMGAKAVVCSLTAFVIGGAGGLGTALYLSLIGLAGVAAGFLVRKAGTAVALLVGVTYIAPMLWPLLPAPLDRFTQRYWPISAGAQIMARGRDPLALPPWAGLGLLAGTVCVTLASAFLVFRYRDV